MISGDFTVLTVNFLSVSMSAWRTISKFSAHDVQEQRALTIFVTAFPIYLMFVTVLMSQQPVFIVLFSHLPIFAINLASPVTKWWRNRNWSVEVAEFLDQLILEMRSGRAFRTSLMNVADRAKGNSDFMCWLKSVRSSLRLGGDAWNANSTKRLNNLVRELAAVDRQSHQALERLLSWRRQHKLLAQLRRRSGQVLLQLRSQGLVAGVVFMAAMSFTVWRCGWRKHLLLYSIASIMVMAGEAWIWFSGRRVKWKF